jgi:para-aminobenzoate synthetase component 1
MSEMNIREFVEQVNRFGHLETPFLFVVDFEMRKPLVFPIDNLDQHRIRFDINGFRNYNPTTVRHTQPFIIRKIPLQLSDYKKKFDKVYQYLHHGDSYLTNLTVKTEINLSADLYTIFCNSVAKYKLLMGDDVLVFSPEAFVRIENGRIFSNPMKGTIDATLPDAYQTILDDQKELAEHVTIVDLIRNDISQVASDVRVTRFRYADEIVTQNHKLLQISSQIEGILPHGYASKLGDILLALLPAGSVSGAPKPKTVSIIRDAEGENRGYYTGIFGYFDGAKLDSGVMIRYIEKVNERYFYRSGGGITTQSVVENEYQEVIDKIYVPVD